MDKPLRLLIVDDSENDAVLLVRQLKQYGYDVTYERVDTRVSLDALLSTCTEWDVAISDYFMPQFSGLAALKVLRERCPDLPCILVSGKLGEDAAVEAMKAGACDYLLKDHLARLGPAIDRELKDVALRREKAEAARVARHREEELRRAQEINRLKDEFIGLISHEMRTPLTVIVGALNTFQSAQSVLSKEEKDELIDDALQEAETLTNIVTNLIETAKIQANKMQVMIEPVNLRESVEATVGALGRRPVTHKIVVNCPASLTASADRFKLERILFNLLDNACKYSPKGSEVRLFASRNQREIRVGVSDEGKGIPQKDIDRLFEPFERLGHDPQISGTGLGLTVCRRMVEAQQGRIWVESKPGQGATFYFTLPAFKD